MILGVLKNLASLITGGVSQVVDTVGGAASSDIWSTIGTGLNLATAGAQLFASRQQAGAHVTTADYAARALELQAADQDLEARREELRGRQEANQIMDALRQTLAAQKVAFAGNGIDIGFGTPVDVRESTQRLAEAQLSTTRDDALARALARRRQGTAYRQEAINTRARARNEADIMRQTGLINAAGTVGDLVQRRIDRG